MTRKSVLGVLLLSWLGFTAPVAAAAEAAPSGPTAADRGQVEAVAQRFAEAWNRHDAKALVAPFGQQADFVNYIGMHWRGREEIERAHARIHETRMKDSQLTILASAVRFLRPDVALLHATWELRGDTGIEGKLLPPRQGVLTFVVARQDGRWLVEAAQNTDIVPIPNVPPTR
jgi:uncharacterized protein (TIGR02246 family)